MSLREQAEKDLGAIMEDAVTGFGWPVTIVNPLGTSLDLVALAGDISQTIDPDTGQLVSGRLAYCSIRISTLYANGLGLPEGISESNRLPWLVTFKDINGRSYTFKVNRSAPDRALGVVDLVLEGWQ